MRMMNDLESLVKKEIGMIVDQGCVKPEQWGPLGEAVDIIKDITTIRAMTEGEHGTEEYSRDSEVLPSHITNSSYSRDEEKVVSHRDNNANETIWLLEERLKTTQDPQMKDQLQKTIEMMKHER